MKPLSIINDKIARLVERVIEIENYDTENDFNFRENHIVANIKVYDWLDEDDVLNIIKKSNNIAYKEEILEEFNAERLNSIHRHVCEMEVEHLKEQYEDKCHLVDYYEKANSYARFLKGIEDAPTYYKNEFIKFSKRKHNTRKDYLKHLKKTDEKSFKELEMLNSFHADCWQFGRMGGWFSICEVDELEDQEFESYADLSYLQGIEDNQEFNKVLNEELEVYSINKRQFIDELEQFIKDWEFKFESINYFVEQIEESTKYFKEGLLQQLNDEVNTFITENLQATQANVKVVLKDNKVITSMGVKVEQNEFINALKRNFSLFNTLENVGDKVNIKQRVGGYFVEYAKKIDNDVLIKAGCHRFSLNNLKTLVHH